MTDTLAIGARTYEAHLIHHRLCLVAFDVKVSTACYIDAYFVRSPLAVEPPVFLLRQKHNDNPGIRCTDAVHTLPHPVRADFPWSRPARPPEIVVVRDQSGDHHVPVKVARQAAAGGEGALADAAFGIVPSPPGASVRQAFGFSEAYDLGEAIRDAIENLPPGPPGFPDQLFDFKVVYIGAEIGGIAGFNRLKVSVVTIDLAPPSP